MNKAVCFTGHRPESMPFIEDEDSEPYCLFVERLQTEIERCIAQGCDTFLTGCATGADIICGNLVLKLRDEKYHNIRLICVIPFEGQDKRWSAKWKALYADMLAQANEKIVLAPHYTRGCYHVRNRYLVDNSDCVIAVYDGRDTGGTAYTTKYAKKKRLEIIIIQPQTQIAPLVNVEKNG